MSGLVSMWWLWYTAFWFHAYIHDFVIFLGVPATILAFGWSGAQFFELLDRQTADPQTASLGLAAAIVMPFFLILPLFTAWHETRTFVTIGGSRRPSSQVQFGLDLQRSAGPDSVVLTTFESPVPLYYSRRHLIQGVKSSADVERLQSFLAENFPGCSIYLGILPEQRPAFNQLALEHLTVANSASLLLIDLGHPAQAP